MAISTMDGIVAALPGQYEGIFKGSIASQGAGNLASLWTTNGNPGAGAVPATGAGAVPTSSTVGAFVFTNPTAPALSYLLKFAATLGINGMLVLYDRLVHTSGLSGTVTTAQTVNSTAITRPDALGANVEAWLEVYTATGATSQQATISYTNQAGTSGQSGVATLPVSAVAGTMAPMRYAAGDTGVRSVQSVTLAGSTGTAGNFGVTLLRRIAELPVAVNNTGAVLDAIALGMPKINDSACLALMVLCSTTTTGQVWGSLTIGQG